MNSLIIRLKGGTGNQLFQAAAIKSLADIYRKSCEFSITNIGNDKYCRKLEIYPLLKNLGVKERKNKSSNKIIYLDEYDIDHPIYFSKSSPLANINEDILFEGYFTNYRIHNSDVIENIKSSIKSLKAKKIFQGMDFIAIHLRELHGTGSDNLSKNIDNLNFTYYFEALNEINKNSSYNKIKNAIVFCDTWEKPENSFLLPKIKLLLQDLNINYFDGDKYINSPLDILNLFSLSKCSIISNSTLSWWGAYLGEGKVFSPVMNLWEPNLKIPDNWKQIYAGEIAPKTHHKKRIFETSIPKNKKFNLRIYSYRRLTIIKLVRKILDIFYAIVRLFFKCSWLKFIGILPENPNKTFI